MKSSPSVLVVDDQAEFREIFGEGLKAGGYDVRTAASGTEAITAVKQSPPDLVLMDVQMPDMTGIDTLSKLKEDPNTKAVKVVFLTNLGNEDSESVLINGLAARDLHAEGYIKKTEDMNVLLREIKSYLAT